MSKNVANESGKTKKTLRVPHTYVLIFCVIIFAAILTFIVPAGEYVRVEDPVTGRTVVNPDSFSTVESNSVGVFGVLTAIPKGMNAASAITFFIFIVAGSFQIIRSTGAIEIGILKVADSLKEREQLLIPIFIFVFSLTGAFLGFAEENIVFIPIAIALSRALGYDALVGMSLVSIGGGVGFSAGLMNPFTVGIAQGVAELPLFSGIGLRILVWIAFYVIATLYVMKYAKKIKANPELSIVASLEQEEKTNNPIDETKNVELKTSHYLVFSTMILGFALIIFGVYQLGWYINEIAAVFLGMGLVSGFICRITSREIASEFISGAKAIVFGALIVGIARAILIVMEDGIILDSVIHSLSNVINVLPGFFAPIGMFFMQSSINFFVPSGSGQAAATMPIMVPLADIVGITRQTSVLAFQLGDGISNTLIPTSATLMASLSIANIPYEKWFAYYVKLFLILSVAGAIFMVIANSISYGPF